MASEYGWAKDDILNKVYFDELFYMSEQIKRRKLTEYKMELAIAQNPHLDPKEQVKLWDELKKEDPIPAKQVEFNDEDFGNLKALLTQSPHFEVK